MNRARARYCESLRPAQRGEGQVEGRFCTAAAAVCPFAPRSGEKDRLRGRSETKRQSERFHHAGEIFKNLGVAEPDDADALLAQECGSSLVALPAFVGKMLAAVELDC